MKDNIYRGWDSKNKIMLEPQDLSQNIKYWNWLGKIDVILMRFTGLLDKNGKMIFESDYIRLQDNYIYEIFWDKWNWGLKNIERQAYGILDNKVCYGEIIGNIYESKVNKKLKILEEGKNNEKN